MVRLGDVAIGTRFILPHTGKTGEVVGQGDMGTGVRYAGSQRHVKGKSNRTGQEFEFTTTGEVTIISNGTEVETL